MSQMPGQTAEKEVATAGGISFGIKEASKGYAPELSSASEPLLPTGGGGLFQVASGPGPPSPPEAEAPTPAVASAISPRANGGGQRGKPGASSAEKKRNKGGASSSSSAAMRGPSPLARGPSPSRNVGPMPSSARRQAGSEHPSQFFAEPGLGSQMGMPAGAGAALLPPPLPPEAASSGPSRPPTGRLSGRPPSAHPPQSSRSQHQQQEVGSTQDAADQAFARAMAQASAGLPSLEELQLGSPHGFEEERQHYSSPPQPPHPMMTKLPSAVTVAGVPVAAQGDLIYLGGGLYASAAPPSEKQAAAPRKKSSTQPSRGARPPRRPLGAAVRSASAHLLGHQGDESPTPSRARSDGQLGLGHLNRAPGGTADAAAQDSARGPPQHGSGSGSVASNALVPPGPKHWRPGGLQKLPSAKLEPTQRSYRLGLEEAGQIPGSHVEARNDARNSKAKEGVALFGAQGVLSQLREMDSYDQPKAYLGPVSGPPMNGIRRQEERAAAKEAKIQQMLEERAIRLATEAALATQKRQQAAQLAKNASAPELGGEDLEKQRMRLACKMEILDFFNGYSNSVTKMTSEQTKVLHAKLHGGGGDFPEDESYEDEQDDSFQEEPSLQDRLQQVNEQCNRVFQSPPEVPA